VHSSTGTSAALFVNAAAGDLHLLPSAAAIDHGTSASAPASDFEGDLRPSGNGYDIGADELLAGPVIAPSAPGDLSATAASTTRINLSWTDNSLTETGFKIERSIAGGAFTQIATVGASVTSYPDSGLTAATQYSYRVSAFNIAGDSGYSNTAGATTAAQETAPAAPTNLVTSGATASAVTLNWTDTAANETGFKIERSVSGGTFAQIGTVGADVATYTDSGLSASTTYIYRVSAYNATGDSAYSNTATATTLAVPPASPSRLTASAISSSQIDLSWSDLSFNETGFRIDRSTDGVNFTQVATVGANVTRYSNVGLAESTSYTYRVRAYNSAGSSAWSNLALAQTLTAIVAPAVPSNLAASANGASQITLTWQDNSLTETGFKVERSINGGAFTQIGTAGLNASSYIDSGLSEGTTYSYRVRATTLLIDSAYSNTASATTAVSVPGAPSNLTATASDATSIVLTWSDNSSNETGFDIERQDISTGLWFSIGTVGAGITSYTDTGLAEESFYAYRVHAINSSGNSLDSNVASATTGVSLPGRPERPSVASVSGTSGATLTWFDNSTNETSFKIERSTDGVNFTQFATVGADATSFSDSGLAAGTTYTYRVRATNSAGDSNFTNVSTIITPTPVLVPTSPNQLGAIASSESSIDLTWADNSSNETGFRLHRASDGLNFTEIATLGANVTSFSDTNITAGVNYTYRIRAFNAAGSSVWSNLASAKTTLAAPAAPADLVATTTAFSATLNWSDNAANETGLRDRAPPCFRSGWLDADRHARRRFHHLHRRGPHREHQLRLSRPRHPHRGAQLRLFQRSRCPHTGDPTRRPHAFGRDLGRGARRLARVVRQLLQ
jgi:titin